MVSYLIKMMTHHLFGANVLHLEKTNKRTTSTRVVWYNKCVMRMSDN